MVGIFFRFSNYVLLKSYRPQEEEGSDMVSCGSPVDNSISSINSEVEELAAVQLDQEEFLPIKHPVEPPNDDRPAKCPLSDYSSNNDEEETFAESLRKRLQSSSDGERHQINSSTRDVVDPPPSRGSQYNVFQMFQQCKE